MSASDRPPLVEIEQAIVGALLLGAPLADCRDLTPAAFADPALGEVYATLQAMLAAGETVDPLTVHARMATAGRGEVAGGIAGLVGLAGSVPNTRNLSSYAALLRDEAARREALSALDAARLDVLTASDWRAAAATAREALQDVERPAGAEAPAFRIVDLSAYEDAAPAPQGWLWAGYIPRGHMTLLAGHGEAGKSVLSLMVALAAATGRDLFGIPTTRCRVTVYSAEDPADMVARRLLALCRQLGVDYTEARQRLSIVDATDSEPLFTEHRADGIVRAAQTRTLERLREFVQADATELLIVDNASDTFDASEIQRAAVRAYVRELVRMMRPVDGAVLLLAHVNRDTAKAGRTVADDQGYSGSTAWHNSARSRLFLLSTAPRELELRHQKCQFGPKREPLRLDWPLDGCMQLPVQGIVRVIAERNDTKALLRAIVEFSARGEFVSTSTSGPGTATQLFKAETGLSRQQRADLPRLIRDAERRGLIEREPYRNANRKPRERWTLTDAGMAEAGLAPVAPVAPVASTGALSAPAQTGAPVAPVRRGGYGGWSAPTTGAETGVAGPYGGTADGFDGPPDLRRVANDLVRRVAAAEAWPADQIDEWLADAAIDAGAVAEAMRARLTAGAEGAAA